MASWFRSWHGAPTDPKWLLIAKKADVPAGMVSAIFWALCDHASQADERGRVESFDVDTYAAFTGWDEDDIHRVMVAMFDKGMIHDGRLTSWERRQPKREDDSTKRVRAFRERSNADESERNAMKRSVTHGNNTDTDTDTDTELIAATNVTASKNGRKPTEKPAVKRIDQRMYDAFKLAYGYEPGNDPERGRWNRANKLCRDAGVTPEDVPRLRSVYQRKYSSAADTVLAMASHAGELLAESRVTPKEKYVEDWTGSALRDKQTRERGQHDLG